ncbi:MAG: hypothetical protein V7673_16620, partial [Paracoccus sp. (in: a-proteobacteria)]|uniref:hypothetical protein n=1 Tax=Paracoccus sp. TaxID=267 RepID=UPI00300139A9
MHHLIVRSVERHVIHFPEIVNHHHVPAGNARERARIILGIYMQERAIQKQPFDIGNLGTSDQRGRLGRDGGLIASSGKKWAVG